MLQKRWDFDGRDHHSRRAKAGRQASAAGQQKFFAADPRRRAGAGRARRLTRAPDAADVRDDIILFLEDIFNINSSKCFYLILLFYFSFYVINNLIDI